MERVITIILPLVVIIALGYASARGKSISQNGRDGINEFVHKIANPFLMFHLVANLKLSDDFTPVFMLSYYITAVLFLLVNVFIAHKFLKMAKPLSCIYGLSCTFGNTVQIGIPIAIAFFGEGHAYAYLSLMAIHGVVLFQAFIFTMEFWGLGNISKNPLVMVKTAGTSLLKNAILIGILAGGAWRFLELPYYDIFNVTIKPIGYSCIPLALFTIGMSLFYFEIKDYLWQSLSILSAKLLVFPLITLVVGWFIGLPAQLWASTILISAMPPGINNYIFANQYKTGVNMVSTVMFVGVLLAILTLSIVLYFLQLLI